MKKQIPQDFKRIGHSRATAWCRENYAGQGVTMKEQNFQVADIPHLINWLQESHSWLSQQLGLDLLYGDELQESVPKSAVVKESKDNSKARPPRKRKA